LSKKIRSLTRTVTKPRGCRLYNYFWVVQFARQLAADRSERAHAEFYALLHGDAAPPPAEAREAVA
jgi:hypothetical protein